MMPPTLPAKPILSDPWHLNEIKPNPGLVAIRNDRERLTAYVYGVFKAWYPEDWAGKGTCLHWTHAGCCVLRMAGLRATLQAGSMSWPIAPDRGSNDTHFEYRWEPHHPASVAAVASGFMPEIHIWIGLPDTQEIVDFSTHSFKRLAEERHGLTWELPAPPNYIWCKAHQLPKGVYYHADMEAIRFILAHIAKGV